MLFTAVFVHYQNASVTQRKSFYSECRDHPAPLDFIFCHKVFCSVLFTQSRPFISKFSSDDKFYCYSNAYE